MSIESFICSAASRHADEPLAASAPHAGVYFLLEHNAEWRAKATTDNDLPGAVQAFMARASERVEGSRWGFIKRPGRTESGGIAFFIAVADMDGAESRLYRFQFERVEDLLDLDLAGLARGDGRYDGHRDPLPLLLVCVNGKRDACCARYGVPAYQALSDVGGERVWSTTHVGGHRFAATGVALPTGVYLGRLDLADPGALLAGLSAGRVPAAHYRGRSAWPQAAQAAEHRIAGGGHIDLRANRLRAVHDLGAGRVQVRIDAGAARHVVTLEHTTEEVQVSCASTQTKAIPRFKVVQHLTE